MKLAIVTCGFLPVPATQGGAVENLVENFINKNEEHKKLDITIFSISDNNAIKISNKYKKSKFIFIEPNLTIKILDKITYFIAKNILKKEKTMSYRYIFQRLYFLNKVSRYLKKNNYDKVLLENHPTLFMALKKKNNYIKYKGRYYYHLHNEINNSYGCDDIIKKSKNNICVSNFIATQLSDFLNLENKSNISVLRNCIDQQRFKEKISETERNKLKLKYNINDDTTVLLFTGRLTNEKGIRELLLSLKKIKNEKYKLLIVGSFFFGTEVKNNFELELNELLSEISDKVIFTGFVDYKDIHKLYSIADVAVLPSIWNDPAPLTIIEALTSGLPIVTTNSGGIPEYVNDKCAFIIDRDEKLVENLSKNIYELINNKDLRLKMGTESLNTSEQLTVENYYWNFIELLGVSYD